jgi:5-methylcytosine-specific restriction endonuclease McrA
MKSYKSKNYNSNKQRYIKEANVRYHTEVGKEMHKARIDRYNQTEKGKLTNVSKRNRRKHIISNTENSFTSNDWLDCLTHFDNSCAYCGCQTKLSQDHVIPVSKLGSYTVDNIVPSCKPCNSSKSNSDLNEWYKTKPYYTYERFNKITSYIQTLQKGVT